MSGRDEESQRVMGAAMRYVKSGDRSELEAFSLPVLRKADYQLSDRDSGSGYRRAIADRISELEARNEKELSTKRPGVVEVKPSFYGVSINFNELWRRCRKWLLKRNG
jgi:hypothetical protein